MKISLSLVAAGLAAALAISAVAGVETTRKTSEVALQEAGAFDDEKIVKVTFGKAVKATAKLYIDEFFGKRIINAGLSAKNTAAKPMFVHYYVAFFDGDGELVGCVAQGSFGNDGIAPGKEEYFGSCLVPIPHDLVKTVKSYRITWYESEKAIGKQ